MKYIKITCLIVLLFTASGCKKWLDVNTDPATPQNIDPEFYLAPIIARMAVSTGTDYVNSQFKYTQNMGAQTAQDFFERHNWTTSDNGGGVLWRFTYVDAGLNIEDVINKSEAKGNNTLAGVGYAIKAWGYQMLTDSHGPIILDEALKDQLTFKYQDQPEVYLKVREWCYKALQKLNTPDVLVDAGRLRANDFLFGQTISGTNVVEYRARWRKFVYAILATQYSHLVNKPQFKAQYADSVVKFVDLSFGGTLFNASEDACINFESIAAANTNPMSVTGNLPNSVASTVNSTANVGSGRIGQPVVSYLTGGVRGTPTVAPTASTDPRLTRMINPANIVAPATAGVYRGVVAAKGSTTVAHVLGSVTAPYPGKYIFGQGTIDKSRWPLYTYSQLQFAKAEALFIKGSDPTAAYTAYERGIRGHMDFVNLYGRNGSTIAPVITAGEITTYMTSSEVAASPADLTLADIMGQKYIAQWGWAGQEQWCDLRKHHYSASVFTQYKQLDAADFAATAAGVGLYAYRLRPRFNSEYVWNKPELAVWGALLPTYSYLETWFSTINN